MADAELGSRKILEPFENDLLYIGFAIAISVFEIIEVRCASDVDAAVPRHHTVRESETVGENGALVIFAIAVSIFEQDNLADRWLAFAGADRVAAIFDDVHAPFFVPGDS